MFEATPSKNEYHAEKHQSVRVSEINMKILQAILYGELICQLIASHLIILLCLSKFLVFCLLCLLCHTKAVLSTIMKQQPWVGEFVVSKSVLKCAVLCARKEHMYDSSATEQLKELISAITNQQFWLNLKILSTLSTCKMDSSVISATYSMVVYLRSNCQLPLQHQYSNRS